MFRVGIDSMEHEASLRRTSSHYRRAARDGPRTVTAVSTRLRRDDAPRCLVGPADRRFHAAPEFRDIRNVGSIPERELLVRTVSFAVLLAGAVREFAARLVRCEARLVAIAAD